MSYVSYEDLAKIPACWDPSCAAFQLFVDHLSNRFKVVSWRVGPTINPKLVLNSRSADHALINWKRSLEGGLPALVYSN